MNKQQILKQIIDLEAEMSNLGSQVNRLEKQYIKFSPINKGDKVLYIEWWQNDNAELRKGIVTSVYFDSSRFFRYHVQPCKKDFTKHRARRSLTIQPAGTQSRGKIQLFK